MCLPRYRRMPGGVYKGQYHDFYAVDVLLMMGGFLSLWVAVVVAVVVALARSDVVPGLVAGVSGLLLGLAASLLPLPKYDLRLLRLGPVIWAWYVALPFMASAVVILVGAAVATGWW